MLDLKIDIRVLNMIKKSISTFESNLSGLISRLSR